MKFLLLILLIIVSFVVKSQQKIDYFCHSAESSGQVSYPITETSIKIQCFYIDTVLNSISIYTPKKHYILMVKSQLPTDSFAKNDIIRNYVVEDVMTKRVLIFRVCYLRGKSPASFGIIVDGSLLIMYRRVLEKNLL